MGQVDVTSTSKYMHTNLNDVPDKLLQPIRAELNIGAAWKDLIDIAGDFRPQYKLRDVEIAKISMAGMAFGAIDTCSDRLLLEFGTMGMTLHELAHCLYASKKFERSLLQTNIKSYEPLKITKHPLTPVEVIEREELKLECVATGFPYPRYTWFKQDEVVEMSSVHGILKIRRAKKSDAGKYTCRVHNLRNEFLFSHVCDVIVADNPIPELDSLTSSVTAEDTDAPQRLYPDNSLQITHQTEEEQIWKKYHEELRLVCEASGHPPPRYQWYKENQPLPAQTRNSLYIKQCKIQDSGNYRCLVTNGVHANVTSRNIKVTVHDSEASKSLDILEQPRSQTIEEGGVVTLKCVANARNGQLSYKWFHNGRLLTSTDSDYQLLKGELSVDSVQTRHDGEYLCMVELHDAQSGQVLVSKTSKTANIEVKLSSAHFKMPTAKYALLIGNGNYRNESRHLPAVVNDLDRTRIVLESLDFKVFSFIDLTLHETLGAVKLFCSFLIPDSYAFLYFAGHGFAEHGNQYLMPYDAPHSPNSHECVCIDQIHVDVMRKSPAMCVIVKDVCHRTFENKNSISRPVKSHVIPIKGRSYVINAAALGEQAYEFETGVKRGIFNKYFESIILKDTSTVPVKVVFNRILEDFRAYLQRYGHQYPMHPEVRDNLMQHQRSLRDPINNQDVDVKTLDKLADKWRQLNSYPTSTAKIEASSTGLSLSTSYAVRHSNWLVITVTIDDLGKFRKCYLELRDLPLDIGGPVLSCRPFVNQAHVNRVFIFDVKDIQKLQTPLEPQLFVVCSCHGAQADVRFSAPLKDTDLQRPLTARWRGWKPLPLKRVPTEGEDGANSLESEPQMIGRLESDA